MKEQYLMHVMCVVWHANHAPPFLPIEEGRACSRIFFITSPELAVLPKAVHFDEKGDLRYFRGSMTLSGVHHGRRCAAP
jgi:hypothetical protein